MAGLVLEEPQMSERRNWWAKLATMAAWVATIGSAFLVLSALLWLLLGEYVRALLNVVVVVAMWGGLWVAGRSHPRVAGGGTDNGQ